MLYADDRRDLKYDSLISFEITREDLLREAETEVDSTSEETYSPIKKPKKLKTIAAGSQKTKRAHIQEKKKVALSKVEAAKIRAKEIFNQIWKAIVKTILSSKNSGTRRRP